jgi:SAM-dependent methyltransferase
MSELKLNLGAGRTYLPGFCNLDLVPWADVRIDLNSEPLPFPNDSVDCVFSYHLLEHLDRYLFALGEIHRVLRHGGRLLVGVPYVTSTEYNLVNPYHRQQFNEFSFDFFEAGKLGGSAVEEREIGFRKVFHRCHYTRAFRCLPEPLRAAGRRHLFNVVRKIDFGLLAVKPPHSTLDIPPGEARRLRDEFDDCLRERRRYAADPLAGREGEMVRSI